MRALDEFVAAMNEIKDKDPESFGPVAESLAKFQKQMQRQAALAYVVTFY